MKKTLLLSIIVLLVGVSSTAFAVDSGGYVTDTISMGTTPYDIVIKLSKNVAMSIEVSDPAAATEPAVNYVMGAYHTTGSRTFGTSNMDQKIYYQETTGVAHPAVGTSTVTPPAWDGWSPL